MVQFCNFDNVMEVGDNLEKDASSKIRTSRGNILFFLFTTVMSLLCTACHADNPNRWKIDDKIINSSDFELHAGQSAIYAGDINDGDFKNFNFKVRVTHSEGAKASLLFHSDETLSKGYSILIGSPTDDRRRSGSLASVRNLYKPVSSSFDLEIKVEGKRIVVAIDGWKVVDYLEPTAPYRAKANEGQLLSSGLIGFRVENGTLNIADADIMPLADNLPNYPDDKEPINEQNDALIRLQQRNFPVIDYHIHWPRTLGLKAAIERSLADGFEFGIAANCGVGFATTRDEQIKALFDYDFTLPPLFYAMQGEGREWPEIFSKEAREMFDYVFTDALTFLDHKGRRTQLWITNTIFMDIPEQEYMDMIMERTLKIINEEPIDFLASPTRLSDAMMVDYDKYWTDVRVAQFIKALKDNNVALEINAVTKVPSAKIIKAAKAAGIKFTLGTNNAGLNELDRLEYSLRMVDECGLTIEDMWFPKAVERYSLQPETKEEIVATILTQPKKVDISSFNFVGDGGVEIPITDKDGMITSRKGVSQEMLTGHQKIVDKYFEKHSTENPDNIDKFYWKSDYLLEEDWTRLYAVFVQMTYDQQQEQMVSFWGPSPYFDRALPPNQHMYELWIEDQKCHVWIDGVKVDNSVLKSHETTDFFRYNISSLRRSGGGTGEYRVDLWTETGLKIFSEQIYDQPVSIDKLLEIEPKIMFLVEKDDNKPTNLYLDPELRNGWFMSKVTSITEDGGIYLTGSANAPTPSTYHQK